MLWNGNDGNGMDGNWVGKAYVYSPMLCYAMLCSTPHHYRIKSSHRVQKGLKNLSLARPFVGTTA